MSRYIDEFLNLKCNKDIIDFFPNAKEITESLGAFHAFKDYIVSPKEFYKNNFDIIVIGDGHQPRTGALFACMTPYSACSIDPVLRVEKSYWKKIINLNCIKDKVENIKYKIINKTIFVLVHAHVHFSHFKHLVKNGDYIINIPCCMDLKFSGNPIISYIDKHIMSKKNRIDIYII